MAKSGDGARSLVGIAVGRLIAIDQPPPFGASDRYNIIRCVDT